VNEQSLRDPGRIGQGR